MNYRKLSFRIMTLSLVLIISGCVSSFVISLKQDHEATYNRMYKVDDEFEVFSANTSVFEEKRDELYTVVLSNVYYDTMYQEDKAIKNKLSNYENLVDELTKNTNNLNKLCNNMYYSSSDTNSKCNNYKSMYEQVVNYFVNDIKNKLSNYENLVDELTKNTNNLDKLCNNMYYSSSDTNSKCNNYKSIYEQVVNYFVNDIKVYNDNVNKYNKYQEDNNSELRISKYSTKKKYIDYNKDKKFDGKEE